MLLRLLCVGHTCAATSGYTSTIITEILCINSGAMHSGHAGSTHLSSLWEDLPQRPGPPLKGHAVTSLSWGASPATCAGFWNKCRSCYGLLPPYRLALAEPSVGSSSYLLFFIVSGMQVPRSVQTVGPACAASQGNSGCVSWLVWRGSRAC